MHRHDLLYDLYDTFDTAALREYQRFIDVFPPVDSRVALDHWDDATTELEDRKQQIAERSPAGQAGAEIAARATRDQAFTALDLHTRYGRPITVLILDVDETLRSAGETDNEIPRSTLAILQEFHDRGVPIIICTGQTLENVKGFAIQGFGASMVQSGEVSIVYESGTGVFTPGHGSETKRLLYDALEEDIVGIFSEVRARVLREAPERIRRGCHLQGNEFNVTLKPNFETGSSSAKEVIEQALVHLVNLLGRTVADDPSGADWARTFYAADDPEIASVFTTHDVLPARKQNDIPEDVAEAFDRIDVAFYEADAAEISSRELNKVAGVEAAMDILDLEDPFAIMMGDSKSDLRVMEWLAATDQGIAAAPEHASELVLEFVEHADELIFPGGRSVDMLRTVDALNRLDSLAD